MSEQEKTKKVSYYRKPDDLTMEQWQIALRQQFALKQEFSVKNTTEEKVFSDFLIYNPKSEKEYKVAIRSYEFGLNFCSCPDFKTNGLGTCKHVEFVLHQLKEDKANTKEWVNGYRPTHSSISIKYGLDRKVFLRIGSDNKGNFENLASDYFDENNFLKEDKFEIFEQFLDNAYKLSADFIVYDDAHDFIIDRRDIENRTKIIDRFFSNGKADKAFKRFVNADLYPYQKEGVLFAAKAGRVLIADDMGLGKTIQAITTTEIWAKHFGVSNVLIIAPTSLKYQWKSEINKFSDRDVRVIEGALDKRIPQYKEKEFYKIASYGVALNDINHINASDFDLIILDEAQKIKNWQTKTAKNIKQLKSDFAIVITGTPLENKIEELHSIVAFLDPYRLGALFRFLDKHQLKDEVGKVIGYDNLNDIGKVLDGILLRRTKATIKDQLPERTDKNYFIDITKEQREIHDDYDSIVVRLVAKWRRFGFLSEKDRKRLLISLGCMRMVSDSTYILDQKTRHDNKITELVEILKDIFENTDNKIVIFSQWERMTRLVARELRDMNIGYEYLFGGVPSKKRKDLISNFNSDKSKRVFLSTDAGGVGLNLQIANIVINLDLPWNPAVLEQRIGRVHRLGQKENVQVINLISKNTIEHKILGTLSFKKSTFDGVLDGGDNRVLMGESKLKKLMNAVEDLNDDEINEYINDNEDTDTEDKPKNVSQKVGNKTSVDNKADEIVPAKTEEHTQSRDEKQKQKDEVNQKEPSEIDINTHEGKTQNDNKDINIVSKPEQEVNELFSSGLDFFEKIGSAMGKLQSGEIKVDDFIEKDKKTGQTSLKIPVKDAETVTNALNSIASMFNAFAKK